MKLIIILLSLIYFLTLFKSYKTGLLETKTGNLLALLFYIIIATTYAIPNRSIAFYVSSSLIVMISLTASWKYSIKKNKLYSLLFIILALVSLVVIILTLIGFLPSPK